MTLTKADIVERICTENGWSKKRSTDMVEALLGLIKGTLAFGEDVLISGFGKFCVKSKKERKGRNPANGQDLMLSPRKVVTFKCSDQLKEVINKE